LKCKVINIATVYRKAVEDTYNSLQAQIETVQSEHHARMTSLAETSSDSDEQLSHMREEVRNTTVIFDRHVDSQSFAPSLFNRLTNLRRKLRS